MTTPARTVFLGSGGFAVPIVAALAGHPAAELLGVVSAPSQREGSGRQARPTPVAIWAASHGLPVLTPARLRDEQAVGHLVKLAPDLIVLADYGQIVPAELLELPPRGALNLHPSLLPRHRGASPIPAAIAAGDSATGVSLMLMDRGLDTGPVIARRELRLYGTETAPELEAALAGLAADLLAETLEPWLARALEAVPQGDDGATLTRTLRREDGRLDPGRPAEELERLVRAHQRWPGSFIETNGARIVVWRAGLRPGAAGADPPGTLVPVGTGLALTTTAGLLELLDVQPAGGRRMSGAELLRGRPVLAGATVWTVPAAGSGE